MTTTVGGMRRDRRAAGVMLIAPDGRVLLLRRSPHSDSFPGYWNLPGGQTEAGEAPHETAARECREETGLSPEALALVDQTKTSRGWTYSTFRARHPEPSVPQLCGEHDAHVWASIDDLPRPLHPGLGKVLRTQLPRLAPVAHDAWEENKHPRADNGQFGAGSSGSQLTGAEKVVSKQEADDMWEDYGDGYLIKEASRGKSIKAGDTTLDGDVVSADEASRVNAAAVVLQDLASSSKSKHTVLHRGTVYASKEDAPTFKKGGTFNFDALTATSSNKDVALQYTSPETIGQDEGYAVVFRINPENAYDRNSSEGFPETILPAGSEFKIGAVINDPRQAGYPNFKGNGIVVNLYKQRVIPKNSQAASTNDTVAFDKSARAFDSSGHMRVESTPISKANICGYYGREIPRHEELGLDPARMYRMYRHPEELAAGASSFAGKPLLLVHAPITADEHPREIVVGSVGDQVTMDGAYLRAPLTVWDGEAIRLIESGARRELSPSYSYVADMTPGVVDGQAYDGVMRQIEANHLALVRKGRTGPDVAVADAAPNAPVIVTNASPWGVHLKENVMKKPRAVLSRRAVLTQGALMAYLTPRLAEDAEVDLAPALRGLNNKNFALRIPKIVAHIEKATAKCLAQDADVSDLAELLDAMKTVPAEEPVAAALADAKPAEGEGGAPAAPPAPGAAGEVLENEEEDTFGENGGELDAAATTLAKVLEFLQDKLSPDDLAAVTALCSESGGAMDDANGAEMPPKSGEPEMVDKKAMDEAVAEAKKTASADAVRIAQEITAAQRVARQYVGELNQAFDSAESVYRTTLEMLKVKDAKTLHADALLPILSTQRKLSDNPKPVPAMDAAAQQNYTERFKGAARIQTM